MADDISVKITADIAQFVHGMNQAAGKIEEAVKAMSSNLDKVGSSSRDAQQAHVGLTGSIQASISEYAAGAAAGLTVANAIEKITEFAKESVKWVYDSGEAVNSWAEQFKALRVTTGESLDSLNEIYAATMLSGEGMDMVEGLMQGWTRGLKSNSDVLIANGVAADKAALQGMTFKEYLLKVYQISTEMKTPGEANVFLTEALGRSGAMAAPKLKELAENLQDSNTAMSTGNLITQARIEMQDRDQKATGELKLAYQKTYAAMGDSMNSIIVPLKGMALWFGKTKVAEDDVQAAIEAGILTTNHWYDSLWTVEEKLKTTLEYFKQLGIAAKEAAKDSWDAGAGDAARKNRTLQDAPGKDKKTPKGKSSATPYVDNEALSILDVNDWSEKYLAKKQETYDKDAKAAKAYADKRAQERAEWENKAYEREQELARKVREAWEQNTATGGMMAYLRETRAAMAQWGTAIKTMLQGVEGAFSSTFKGILSGQMTIKQALTNLWQGLRDAVVGMIAEMLAKWITSKLIELVIGKTTAASEATAGAAVYAVNAMQSVAAIPFYGWAMAPAVGAAAYATGMGFAAMASAAGGWGDVPSDQLAMIHKNEMVLPAKLAEGARQTFEGGGAGTTEIHIHTVDAHSFEAMLLRNQGALANATREVIRNGVKGK